MSYEDLKKFDVASLMRDATGEPLKLCVEWIAPDPDNIRTRIDPEALRELADSIAAVGLIQPISVRTNPARPGHYLINVGERRWRAVQLLGHERIAAFVHERVDPYCQAAENVHREGLNLMDLAGWIARREAAGETRATIARRLGKPRSFITEVATLIDAPPEIVAAVDRGRVNNSRVAYVLTKAWGEDQQTVRSLLVGESPLTRPAAESALPAPPSALADAQAVEGDAKGEHGKGRRGARRPRPAPRPEHALGVTVEGRAGRLELRPGTSRTSARVVFADGAREEVPLQGIRLTQWLNAD